MKLLEQLPSLKGLATPFYYYDMDLFLSTVRTASQAAAECGIKIHYALKANYEEKLLKAMAQAGFGADCVSSAEILLAREAGFDMQSVVFAGVGKTDCEIRTALQCGIGAFNVESLEELAVIDGIASGLGVKAPVCLRINPNIDAHTHKYVTTGLEDNKFGISDYLFDEAVEAVKSSANIEFKGLQFHIGSQITDVEEVFGLECRRAGEICAYFRSKGLDVKILDLGGGLGVDYEHPDRNPIPDFKTWFSTISKGMKDMGEVEIHVEPGRSLVCQCASLVSRVTYVKKARTKTFVILDAGMGHLIRPALYGSFHKIENLDAQTLGYAADTVYDVVGPVCESADVFASDRLMQRTVRGDMVAIRSAGAYGSVMSSRYNLRPEACAVFSDELK